MGLFSSGNSTSAPTSGTTIVASGSIIKGTIELSCNLHVDGEVEGTVISRGTVTIGRKGQINGDIQADKVIVSGVYDGFCSVNSLEITKTGLVKGQVKAAELVIAKGGQFRGQCEELEAQHDEPPKQPSGSIDADQVTS